MCVGAGTSATFESVRITGATIVATNQARVTLSRCTLTDCPVAVLAQGRGSQATLRRCTAHGCAAVAAACGGASVRLTDVVATMPHAGGVAVDARGAGSHVHANGVVIQAPEDDRPSRAAPRDAGFRGRDGATLEVSGCAVSQCIGGVDLGGVGTVGEVKGCKVRSTVGDGVVVRGGAAGDLDKCNVIMSGGRGIVAEGLGSNVHAAECTVQGPAGDAVAAAAGGAVRAHSCQLSAASAGCGVTACGTGSFAALYHCVLDGNASGVRASEGGIIRAEETSIARCVTGSGAHAEGQGSAVQLEGCYIRAAGGDGVAAEGGGMVEGRRVRVRTAGLAGGATGAGSCMRVTGVGSVVRMYEGSFSRGAGGNVLVEMGGGGSLHGCEVTAGVVGGGVQALGPGTSLELRQCRVHANEGGGVRVADGAHVMAAGSNIAGGVDVRGMGAQARLEACEVLGAAVQSGGGELVADGCAFEVRPQSGNDDGAPVELTDCLWGRDEPPQVEVGMPADVGGLDRRDRAEPAAVAAAAELAEVAAALPLAGAAAVSDAAAVSGAVEARRHVFQVAEEGASGSGEGSGSVAGGLEAGAGLPRVGDLPAAYAAEEAEAAQAEATLAPSVQVRGTAERRDASASRRRRHIFGPFLGGGGSGGSAGLAANGAPLRPPLRPIDARGPPAHPPNPSGPSALSQGVLRSGAVSVAAGTGASDPESITDPALLAADAGQSGPSGGLPGWAPVIEAGSRPGAGGALVASSVPATAAGSGDRASTESTGSSRTALRWLRVAGRQRSGGHSSIAAPARSPSADLAAGAAVSISDAAAVAAAASVAAAARRRGTEVTSRTLDVRPLLLPNPDSGSGRAWGAHSRGGSTDWIDSGAESGGHEERPSAVLYAAADSAATGASGAEDTVDVRRRSGLMRALQRVRRGRRQSTSAAGAAV